jgi:TfoX/Sxy family transcriptional regulator of competence genes
MSSTPGFVEYVCEQIAGAGEIRHKKMFGDDMVYVNDRPVLLVCDNAVYVKRLACVAAESAAPNLPRSPSSGETKGNQHAGGAL